MTNNFTTPEFTTRDKLAIDRTRLANERTFLAYVRTGLSLLAAAAVMFQFFSSINAYITITWVLMTSGAVVLLIGIFRFYRVRRKIDSYQSNAMKK